MKVEKASIPLSLSKYNLYLFEQQHTESRSMQPREKMVVFVQAHWQFTDCVGKCDRRILLPDHFCATFVDLHVHHASRVDIGGQVDLWELCLGNKRWKKNRDQVLHLTPTHNIVSSDWFCGSGVCGSTEHFSTQLCETTCSFGFLINVFLKRKAKVLYCGTRWTTEHHESWKSCHLDIFSASTIRTNDTSWLTLFHITALAVSWEKMTRVTERVCKRRKRKEMQANTVMTQSESQLFLKGETSVNLCEWTSGDQKRTLTFSFWLTLLPIELYWLFS